MKIVRNTVVNMTFQYGWEPVLIQRILISFEAILENFYAFYVVIIITIIYKLYTVAVP